MATEGSAIISALFADYPAKSLTGQSDQEGISLAEGREIFGGRTVLGGFENGKMDFFTQEISMRSKQKPNASSQKLEPQAWSLVPTCTIPSDIDEERIEWVREVRRIRKIERGRTEYE